VERANAAVEDLVREAYREDRDDNEGAEKDAADHDALDEPFVPAPEILCREGQEARKQIDSRRGSRHPGHDGEDLSHEAAHHGEQPRYQHDDDQEDIEIHRSANGYGSPTGGGAGPAGPDSGRWRFRAPCIAGRGCRVTRLVCGPPVNCPVRLGDFFTRSADWECWA